MFAHQMRGPVRDTHALLYWRVCWVVIACVEFLNLTIRVFIIPANLSSQESLTTRKIHWKNPKKHHFWSSNIRVVEYVRIANDPRVWDQKKFTLMHMLRPEQPFCKETYRICQKSNTLASSWHLNVQRSALIRSMTRSQCSLIVIMSDVPTFGKNALNIDRVALSRVFWEFMTFFFFSQVLSYHLLGQRLRTSRRPWRSLSFFFDARALKKASALWIHITLSLLISVLLWRYIIHDKES